ncbi:MAG TPA: hypothetical protein VN455_06610 [Methanotrichaceae archaeon]|nr:hypothetical protein [Methanotrichaceae archaeon]
MNPWLDWHGEYELRVGEYGVKGWLKTTDIKAEDFQTANLVLLNKDDGCYYQLKDVKLWQDGELIRFEGEGHPIMGEVVEP